MDYKDLNFSDGTRFLVTGGAGFIGSNLCEAIINMGYHVRCLDNFSTGKRENLLGFEDSLLFELHEGDIRDTDTCLEACEGMDYVLHQAAWGSVPRSIEMPLFYEEVNIKGTLNMLEAARQNKVKKFVYASSSSVYGDEPNLPKVEGREGKLLSPYALTKHVNEEYARLYTSLYGLPTIGLRYFNVFGRRQDANGAYAAVIPKFVSLLLQDKAPTINGDGTQSRDFTYIENVIQANLMAATAPQEADGQAYNIAYGGCVELLNVYKLIAAALDKEYIQPSFCPDRKGDIKHSNADISKAMVLLGYNPEWSFEEGLTEAIGWYRGSLA